MKFRFLIACIILALVLTGTALAQGVPERPVIRLDADGVIAEEAIFSYCWPVAEGNNQCNFAPDLGFTNPQSPIEVDGEQSLTVIIDGSPGNPATLTITVFDANGRNPQAFLGEPTAQSIFDENMSIGEHVIQVDATYDNVAGVNAYISYRFKVTVLPPPATATPTPSPTPEETEEPMATEEIMDETPTDNGTPVDGTPAATEVGSTGQTQPTTAPDQFTATPNNGQPPVATTDSGSGQQVQPTTSSDTGATATTIPLQQDSGAPPQPTSPPQPTPTSPIAQPNEPPAIQLIFAGASYDPVGVNFCQQSAENEQVCVDRPLQAGTTIDLLQGFPIQVQILEGDRPIQLNLAFVDASSLAEVATASRAGDRLTLFNVNANAGTYLLRIGVDYGDTNANYFFRVRVK